VACRQEIAMSKIRNCTNIVSELHTQNFKHASAGNEVSQLGK